MRDKRRVGIYLLLLAGIGALALFLTMPGASDAQLIREALEESIRAGKEGRPGSVLDLLSREFTINEREVGSYRDVARAIRDARPDVEIENWAADISAETAVMVTPVKVKLRGPLAFEARLAEVRLEFRKETGTKWLVIPTRTWKLHRVQVPEWAIRDLGI